MIRLLTIAGATGLVGCRVHQFGWHRDWSELQAICELWPVHLAAGSCVCVAAVIELRRLRSASHDSRLPR